jgi:hypothetical protein
MSLFGYIDVSNSIIEYISEGNMKRVKYCAIVKSRG